MKENIAEQKSFNFAVKIIKLAGWLKEYKKDFIISDQIFRSGTSIGANVAEAQCAITRKDFSAKISISYKECSETKYWLKLLKEVEYITKEQFEPLFADCMDLMRILSATMKTVKQNNDQ